MQTTVGIRALRDGLTRYLGRVRRGARVVITDRGEPVALLIPYRSRGDTALEERLAALYASGHVIPAQRRFLKNPPLVRGGGRPMSELLSEDRR